MEVETKPSSINNTILNSAYSYESYLELLNRLFEEGKTTGNDHSEAMLNYAKINLQRMNRLNKTIKLSDEIKSALDEIQEAQTWLVISEGWCGDAAQNLPAIAKIAEQSEFIDLKIILRDENLEVMDEFLTNGGRSIPKLIALNKANLTLLGTWGPRPQVAQDMVKEFKKIPDGDYQEFQKDLQLWYAKDKSNSLQTEFIGLLKEWDLNNNK